MLYIKVCTAKQNIGKYVRFFIPLLMIIILANSCNVLDEPNTEDIINNITGNWNCEENSTAFGTQNYDVTISKTSEISVHINGFFIEGLVVYAEVEGYNITIPKQTVDSYEISGTGTISSSYNKINWSYSITDDGGTDAFTAVYTPK